MSNKWTIELIEKHIKVGNIIRDKDGDVSIFKGIGENNLIKTEDGYFPGSVIDEYSLEFYDNMTMAKIEPPKERGFEIRCEFHQINSSVIKLLPENWSEDNYVKLPKGRRYKRYKDNGELEVIENE